MIAGVSGKSMSTTKAVGVAVDAFDWLDLMTSFIESDERQATLAMLSDVALHQLPSLPMFTAWLCIESIILLVVFVDDDDTCATTTRLC